MNRKLRGIAVGTVVAIIVIVTVTAFALYKVWQATSQGYRALTEYAIAAQKPMFKIENFYMNGSNMVLRVVNLGPSAAVVRQAILHQYSFSDVPTSVYPVTVNRYIPVGGYFEVPIPLANLSSFVAYNRPLRLIVDTDRGLVLIGMDAPQSKLVVNVYLPVEYQPDYANPLKLVFSCIGASVPGINEIPLVQRSGPGYNVTLTGKTYTVEVNVYGIGVCKVILDGALYMPIVAAEQSEFMRVRGESANPTQTGTYAYLFYRHIKFGVQLQYTPTVVVGPGTAPTVDIKIPDVFFGTCTEEQGVLQCPPRQTDQSLPAYIMDFSWYFTPVYSGSTTDAGSVKRFYPYNAALEIVKRGVVIPTSHQGCPVSPRDGDPPNVVDLIANLTYKYTWVGTLGNLYAIHTGLPIVIYNYPNGCSNIRNSDLMLEVVVPFTLPAGKYLVVPVFSYDDKGDQDISAFIETFVKIPGPPYVANPTTNWTLPVGETCSGLQTCQLAPTILLDTPGGLHTLHIWVYNARVSGNPKADYIALILSKIVVFRLGNYSTYCVYRANRTPAFPWVEINLQNGSVVPYGKIIINPIQRIFRDYVLPEDVQRMTLFYYNGSGSPINQPLRYMDYFLFVGGNVVADDRGYYVAPGYNISISVSVDMDMLAYPALVQLLLGSADQPYAASPCIYYRIPDICEVIVNYLLDKRPSIISWVHYYNIPDIHININITFGESGRHYVVIGLHYSVSPFYSNIYLSTPPAILTNMPVVPIYPPPTGSTPTYSIYPPIRDDQGNQINYAEVIFAVDATAGSTLVLSVYNPSPSGGHSILAITHIAVVKPPSDITALPVAPRDAIPTIPLGIVLRNATFLPGVGTANILLMSADNGETVASWVIDNIRYTNITNILLSIRGFSRLAATLNNVIEKNLHEYPFYYLIVSGLQCSATGTSAGTNTSTGGGSGSSSSGGGSSSTSTRQVMLTNRGAVVYTDFESYPVPGWTNLGGSNFGTTTGHRGNALQFTVGNSTAFGLWAAYYYNQPLTQYSSLWVAVKTLGSPTNAYKGIVLLNSNLNALYEVVIYSNQVHVWRYYNGWTQLASATISGFNSNYWYTIVVNYAVSGSTITIYAWVYDPNGYQVASITATDSGPQVFTPAYIGVLVSALPGTYAQFDDFIISRTDPKNIVFSNLQSGMTVKIYDDLGNLVHSFTATSSNYSLNVVNDIVLGTGGSGRIEVYDSNNKLVATYTGVILGGDSYALQ